MTTTASSSRRPYRRAGTVVIDLPQPALNALIELAVREDRDIVGQARRLITDGLARAGLETRAPDR